MGLSWWISKRTIPLPYCQIEQQKPWQPGKKDHPGIEILSRIYKRRMIQGSPNTIQVADRSHLLRNLEETLEKALKGHSKILKQVEQDQL